jgi:hypothetical protein
MTFDIQAPGLIDLLVFPAILVVLSGLLLRRRFKAWLAVTLSVFVPGVVALLLTMIDEQAWDRLAWAPVGWGIWTMLTLPGAIVGVVLLIIIWQVQAFRRARGG